MADNRLRLICKACEDNPSVEYEDRFVRLARLPVGGDWTPPRTDEGLAQAIAEFINEHRWCGCVDQFEPRNFALEWESEIMITSGATPPKRYR